MLVNDTILVCHFGAHRLYLRLAAVDRDLVLYFLLVGGSHFVRVSLFGCSEEKKKRLSREKFLPPSIEAKETI